ncbi:MAG: prepilin-type N-terminal cleavage/methylation domain-containing protein [Acidobacteriota bacterium]|nr:prepilin-type N-terminal cleavage/methylation domain-containing protein [Acidobacteriota bacterium]
MRVGAMEDGFTLIECMVALVLAVVGVFGLGSVIYIATATSNNQGSKATRATIYAQDKIEKLLSLDFNTDPSDPNNCNATASLLPASCNTTGISAGGWDEGLLAGGSISSMAPDCGSADAGYADFLDAQGNQITGSSCSALSGTPSFIRQWAITDLTAPSGGPPLKQITVAVYSLGAQSNAGGIPIVVLTSILSDPN